MPDQEKYQRLTEIGTDLGRIAGEVNDKALSAQLTEYASELQEMSEGETGEPEGDNEEMATTPRASKETYGPREKMAIAKLKNSVKI